MANKFHIPCKPTYLPALPGEILLDAQSPSISEDQIQMDKVPYAQAIGHVLWLVMITHPDTVFQVSWLAQFVKNPSRAHWNVLKRLIFTQ
jgi:hypothetical protein